MIRRYGPLKPSRGTVIDPGLRLDVMSRDDWTCVGKRLGWASHVEPQFGPLELDHVRASHGIGMKSRTERDNLVALCGECHRYKTDNGRAARPLLLAYLERFYRAPLDMAGAT